MALALRSSALCVVAWTALACVGQVHPALLPRAQQVTYGQGSIPICNLTLPGTHGEDDASVAELRAWLKQHCGSKLRGTLPLRLDVKQRGTSLPGADDHADAHGRESYHLSIRRDGVAVQAPTTAGIFYGAETLRQMAEGDSLPIAEVDDWPSLSYRGFMMDMSHGAVLTVKEVKRQIDGLARWKANQYFFYVETDLDLPGYPLLHKDSSWSADDIGTIVRYARARHIDVVPCVELFGHLHDLFRIEKYSSMAALPHGGEANPADAGAQKLLDDWLRAYVSLFASRWLHLGFDEPFELERTRSKITGVSPETLWLQQLQHAATLAAQLGKRPIFWADIDEGAYIFNKYPGLASGLPRNAIAAPWFYNARPSYDNLLGLFAANHVPILVASGISDWDNITPDFESTSINIDGMLAAGRKANALGLLNTEWSDSALALHRQADSAMAYGAVAAWQSTPVDRDRFFQDYAALTNDPADAPHMARALQSLRQAQTLLLKALGSETSFRMFDDPFRPATLARVRAMQPQLVEARLHAETATEDLLVMEHRSGEAEDLLLGARMMDLAAMKFLYAVEIAANFDALPEHPTRDDMDYLLKRESAARNHSRVGDLIDLTGELAQQYQHAWLQQYKPYRLPSAMARWQAEQTYWIALQGKIWYVVRNYKEGDPRPTLSGVLAMR